MTNNQLEEQAQDSAGGLRDSLKEDKWERMEHIAGFKSGVHYLQDLITNHLKSLPLDQMSGKQVEESLWNEFLHIQ